jgi:hypothetical protein
MPASARGIAVVIAAIFISAAPLAAQDFDPLELIGLDPVSALEVHGAPREVFPFRGVEEPQDNVVFFYPDFTYLFWFKNRVWQVRCDKRFNGTLFGLRLGMSREEAKSEIGRIQIEQGDSLYFDVIEATYPIRVRLVFADGILSDVYVYRSDF